MHYNEKSKSFGSEIGPEQVFEGHVMSVKLSERYPSSTQCRDKEVEAVCSSNEPEAAGTSWAMVDRADQP